MSLFNTPAEMLRELHAAVYDGLSAGSLKPVVSRKFSLADAPLAHHAVIEHKANGKIVLIP